MQLTKDIRQDYVFLFQTCEIHKSRRELVAKEAQLIISGRSRYEELSKKTGVPWWFIGLLHYMESRCSFSRHLHNGDSLKKRTWQHPAGRPKTGNPPFTFEESALDALQYQKLTGRKDWALADVLFRLESFNGFGYRLYKKIESPYLWSFSNHYVCGKYVSDQKYDPKAVSDQCGTAVILRYLHEEGLVAVSIPDDDYYFPELGKKSEHGMEFQRWLNLFPGVYLEVDGIPGQKTMEAYTHVTGRKLSNLKRS